jgi:hypothetical protein
MAFYPSDYIAEVLGVDTAKRVDPATSNYLCPYIDRTCTKRSTADKEHPYPVCTLLAKKTKHAVCVCPKRFYQTNFLQDVADHCWPWAPPSNLQFASEVKMKGFGNVDYVIADVVDGHVDKFLSVELQAIDITGSARPAYDAYCAGEELEKAPTYNFNWDNVYKRYITQLIRKGYFHHHWGSKIVAVVQDVVYDDICSRASFMTSVDIKKPDVNIVFVTYSLSKTKAGDYEWKLKKIEGTSHSALQSAVLYTSPPDKGEFCQKILSAIDR